MNIIWCECSQKMMSNLNVAEHIWSVSIWTGALHQTHPEVRAEAG